eukprot:12420726-Karenia_brevis.AAC.1
MLRPNGWGSYLMRVAFVGGGSTEITADSGGRRVSVSMGVWTTGWLQSSEETAEAGKCQW